MKIITGDYEVFKSGIVYCPDMDETKFVISEEPRMEIVVRINTTDKNDRAINLEAINDYTLAFIFSNPTGLGYGNASPVKVGHLNGKEFYANFHVDIKGDYQAYTLNYSFLLKEASNG